MRPSILSSIFIVSASFTSAAPTMAHPTNGHLCTEILRSQDCFVTEGFCEWVQGRCIYRCDLHDSPNDCGQIKEGCNWDGMACVEVNINVDGGLSASDTGTTLLDTGTPEVLDAMPKDMLQIRQDMRLGTNDALVVHVDSGNAGDALKSGESATGCSTSSPVLTSPVILALLFFRRRKRRC